MPLLFAIMLQAATAGPPEKIDLTIRQQCQAPGPTGDEIVVCADRGGPGPYRIIQTPPRRPGLPKAETQIAHGVKLAGETEKVAVGGFPSERFMLRLKMKF